MLWLLSLSSFDNKRSFNFRDNFGSAKNLDTKFGVTIRQNETNKN